MINYFCATGKANQSHQEGVHPPHDHVTHCVKWLAKVHAIIKRRCIQQQFISQRKTSHIHDDHIKWLPNE